MEQIKKVEGFAGDLELLPWGHVTKVYDYKCPGAKYPATLFISPDSTPPRVFTAQQVEKMFADVLYKLVHRPEGVSDTVWAEASRAVFMVANDNALEIPEP